MHNFLYSDDSSSDDIQVSSELLTPPEEVTDLEEIQEFAVLEEQDIKERLITPEVVIIKPVVLPTHVEIQETGKSLKVNQITTQGEKVTAHIVTKPQITEISTQVPQLQDITNTVVDTKEIVDKQDSKADHVSLKKHEDSKAVQEITSSSSSVVSQQTVIHTLQSKTHTSEHRAVHVEKSGSEKHIPYRIDVHVDLETRGGFDIDDDMSHKYTEYTSSSTARSGW